MEPTQVEPSAEVLACSTLDRIDYADSFVLDGVSGPPLTGEDWARLVLEGPPLATRTQLVAGWCGLGLRLRRPGTAGTVLGWPIVTTSEHLLLAADSLLGLHGQLLFRPRPQGLLVATLVRLDNPLARRVWAGVVPTHCRVVSALLRRTRVADHQSDGPTDESF